MNKRKKILVALLLSMATATGVMAQDGNMAFGCTATASTEAGSHTADKAVDGNSGGDSRWESLFDGVADADAQWWSVDLGAAREFDMIQIVWEGAYAKAFRIVAGNKADFSDAAVIVERDETLTSLTQNYDLDKAVTARYVRFEGVERALPYGYSFYEFGVYKKSAPVLTMLTATPADNLCRVGGSIDIACSALDQYGRQMDAGSVSYDVSPAGAGTFRGNTYTPAMTGAALITARAGGVSAEPFEIVAYDGSNVASAEKVTGHNEEADAAGMGLAFDGNEGPGEWTLHGNTGDSEAGRTYDAWFTLDLGRDYVLSLVSVCFEGAGSSAYTIDFSADGTTWHEAAAVSHPAGINAWKDRIGTFAADASAVRYVRFMSTRAATQYGVKVREFAVYGRAVGGEIVKPSRPDDRTGAYVLDGELNAMTAEFFATDGATAYDLRGLTIAEPVTVSPQNPNAMLIVTDGQKALLSGAANIVVEAGGEYVADRIVLTDGHDVNTSMTVRAAEVAYTRMAGEGYQTLVVPFAAPVPAGARAYAMVDRTSAGVLFQESTAIEAGRSYLVTGASQLSLSATDAVLDFATVADSGDEASFCGTYATVSAAGRYILDANSQFRRAAADAVVPAFRAYLTLADGSQAKVGVVFGNATGIGAVPSAEADGDAVYSLSGIRMSGEKMKKGIYVKGGKVIVL